MLRIVAFYAVALAIAAAGLDWLEYRYAIHAVSAEIYVALVATGFVAIGIWIGRGLTPQTTPVEFRRNDAAIRSLGLTPRECEILHLLASGQSNKELARSLAISPNTVKTHVARIYEKLEVDRRVQAIEKARWLLLIP